MPENNRKRKNGVVKNRKLFSNITRVTFIVLLTLSYFFFLSPYIEPFITKNIASVAQQYSSQEINRLSPIFDMHVYALDYNLLSSPSRSSLSGRTRFLTLDPRIEAMTKFLSDYQSPMIYEAETFIVAADEHGLDWRLIASISGVESAFGNLIPRGSHNGWGWRGRNANDGGWSMFVDWNEAITHITERMAVGYGTDLSPYDIESTYCPPCGATGLHLWANGVSRYMNELEYYVNNLENL